MSESGAGLEFRNLTPLTDNLSFNKLHLLILKARNTPPHIGLTYQGLYYDLQVKRKNQGTSFSILLETIRRKNIPVIFLELSSPDNTLAILNAAFSQYQEQLLSGQTCLFPIREVLGVAIGKSLLHCATIFDLIPELHRQKAIINQLSLNLLPEEQNLFIIKNYSPESILRRIKELAEHAEK